MAIPVLDPLTWPLGMGTVYFVPKSDDAPAGWGQPVTEANEPLGTIGGTPNGVIIDQGGAVIQGGQDTVLPFNVDWVNSDKTEQLHWGVGIVQYVQPIHRYACIPNGTGLYRNNSLWCSSPGSKIFGASIAEINGTQYVVIVTNTASWPSVRFVSYRRVFAESYTNNNMYDAQTEPLGWEEFGDSGLMTYDAHPDAPNVYGLQLQSGIYFSGDGLEGGAAAWAKSTYYRVAMPVGEFFFNVTTGGVTVSFTEQLGYLGTATETEVSTVEPRIVICPHDEVTEVTVGEDAEYIYTKTTSKPTSIIGVDYKDLERVRLTHDISYSVTETETYEWEMFYSGIGTNCLPSVTGNLMTWIRIYSKQETATYSLDGTQFVYSVNYNETETNIYCTGDQLGQEGYTKETSVTASSAKIAFADLRYGTLVTQQSSETSSIIKSTSSYNEKIVKTVDNSDNRKTILYPGAHTVHNGTVLDIGTWTMEEYYPGQPSPRGEQPLTTTSYTGAGPDSRITELFGAWQLSNGSTYGYYRCVNSGVVDAGGNAFIVFAKQIGEEVTNGETQYDPPYVDPTEQVAFYSPWGFDVPTKLNMTGAAPRWESLRLV